jgi:micrococcal nuclease
VPIIVPDNPGLEAMQDTIRVEVAKVFDGDGFLANVWHPRRQEWGRQFSFRFAFIDAPEIGQICGLESKEFLSSLIDGKELQLGLIGKESTGGMPIDPYKRLLCVAFLIERMPVGKIEFYKDGNCASGMVKRARSVIRNIELEMVVNGSAWVVQQYSF